MVLRFCAIFLVIMVLMTASGIVPAAKADLFAHHYKATEPPRPVSIFTFEDAHGRVFNIKDFQGQYVLLDVWATWCGPCAHEMPALDLLSRQFEPRTLQVIALTEDHDGLAAATSFYKRHDIQNLEIFVDKVGHVPSLIEARGLPTTLLIDPQGMEIGRVEGETEWSSADAVAFLKNHIR